MTTTPARPAATRLRPAGVDGVLTALESDFGRLPDGLWDPRHHYLLHALDRGEIDRFVVWGDVRPQAVIHLGVSGTVVPAGDPDAGADFATFVDRARWRILIGDQPIGSAVLDAAQRSWFRRRPSTRIQRFMVLDGDSRVPMPSLAGFRRAWRNDLDALEEFACRLHLEDRMGTALVGGARAAVRQRMADSIERGTTWVVERAGQPIGKLDLALRSTRRGAQISGVYLRPDHRGQGIGATMVATLCEELLAAGLPVVSLHVRDDNVSAIAAYRRAGFVPRGDWVLALR